MSVTDEPVYIGNKRPMRYADAAMMNFDGGNDEVVLKSRGQATSTAVDTAEIVKRMVDGIEIKDIEIDTEIIQDEETGDDVRLSSLRIVLTKEKKEE